MGKALVIFPCGWHTVDEKGEILAEINKKVDKELFITWRDDCDEVIIVNDALRDISGETVRKIKERKLKVSIFYTEKNKYTTVIEKGRFTFFMVKMIVVALLWLVGEFITTGVKLLLKKVLR